MRLARPRGGAGAGGQRRVRGPRAGNPSDSGLARPHHTARIHRIVIRNRDASDLEKNREEKVSAVAEFDLFSWSFL